MACPGVMGNAQAGRALTCPLLRLAQEAGKRETDALGTQISIPDALRFKGVGPEFINSRLAMVGSSSVQPASDVGSPHNNLALSPLCAADRRHDRVHHKGPDWRQHL